MDKKVDFMAKNIEINIKTSSGYETLYPENQCLKLSGGTVNGNLIVNGNTTVNGSLVLPNSPVNGTDATNKNYVDGRYTAGNGISINNGVVSAKAGEGIIINDSGIKLNGILDSNLLTEGWLEKRGDSISASGNYNNYQVIIYPFNNIVNSSYYGCMPICMSCHKKGTNSAEVNLIPVLANISAKADSDYNFGRFYYNFYKDGTSICSVSVSEYVNNTNISCVKVQIYVLP